MPMKKPIGQTLFDELDASLSTFGSESKKISIDILGDIFGSYVDIMFNGMYWNTCSRLDIDPNKSVNISPRQKIINLLKIT